MTKKVTLKEDKRWVHSYDSKDEAWKEAEVYARLTRVIAEGWLIRVEKVSGNSPAWAVFAVRYLPED